MAAKYSDTPLSLIPTPHKQTGKNDNFTMDASHMALVHNVIIMGYNSIYQQAPHIRKADVRDFICYCIAWHEMVINHHRGEETVLFPLLELATGVPGLMDVDKQEHEAFYGGMEKFKRYLDGCLNTTGKATAFDGKRLVALMDSFGSALHTHLSNEPPHIASLARYPDIDTATIRKKTERDSMDRTDPVYQLPMLLFNLDVEFEEGKWKDFPGLSPTLRWIMVNIIGWWRSNWWRFGSVDRNGKRVQLLALRDGY